MQSGIKMTYYASKQNLCFASLCNFHFQGLKRSSLQKGFGDNPLIVCVVCISSSQIVHRENQLTNTLHILPFNRPNRVLIYSYILISDGYPPPPPRKILYTLTVIDLE